MWKILLVEDEVFVRRKLRKLIHWEQHGFTVAGEASDGVEALDFIRRMQPDLVITDIMMPNMDGLELLRQVRGEGADCRFVMLTCMGEFEYARKALELGASGYVLKLSMSIAEMEDMLHKTGKEIARSTQQEQLVLVREFDRYYRQLRDALPVGNTGSSPFSAAADAPAPPAIYNRVCLMSFLSAEIKLTGETVIESGDVASLSKIWTGSFHADGITTLFFWSNDEITLRAEPLSQSPFKGVYGQSVSPSLLKEEWQLQLQLMNKRWYEETGGLADAAMIQFGDEDAAAWDSVPFPPSWKREKEVIAAFEQARPQELRAALFAYWQELRAHRVPLAQVCQTARSLDRILTNIAGEADSVGNLQPEQARSHEELFNRLAERANRMMRQLSSEAARQDTNHPEINRILDYVERHYGENITLKGMSRIVAMDEHYLSRLFKQKTGETFICYLQQLRVKKAMLLLKETGQPISEIGRSVGFPNDNYFVKTFKKWGDVTPGQYRKMSQQV